MNAFYRVIERMTKEIESLTLEQLDEAVAVEVMGWKKHDRFWDAPDCEFEDIYMTLTGEQFGVVSRTLWNPSEDWRDAGIIFETTANRMIYRFPVCPNLIYHHTDHQWHCEFFSGDWMRNAVGPTAEIAICRASLLAVRTADLDKMKMWIIEEANKD